MQLNNKEITKLKISVNDDVNSLIKKLETLICHLNKIYLSHLIKISKIRQIIKSGNKEVENEIKEFRNRYELDFEEFQLIKFDDHIILNSLQNKFLEYFDSNKLEIGHRISRPDRFNDVFNLKENENIGTIEVYLGKFKKKLEENHNSIYQKISSTISKIIMKKHVW
ncbi:hypothetical protein [Aquimarina longa]|uniref:hypothetical protein n=1 Tax=Aquimarina longa TaxID=1080221 RepID=UPI00078508E2|nr:hypothetical protein [Aquimarina longa]